MEELVKKLERVLDQNLEVHYDGEDIIVESSETNPPEQDKTYLKFESKDEAVRYINFIIAMSKL